MSPVSNTQSMMVSITWQLHADYDLYVERRSPSGNWVELGSSTGLINTSAATIISNMFPGHYRARVINFAAAP